MEKGLFFIFILIFLVSCKKKVDTIIQFEGIVLNAKDNMPISNVTVKLLQGQYIERSNSVIEYSTMTDINGNYNFLIENYEYDTYFVKTEKDRYVDKHFGTNGMIIHGRKVSKTSVNVDTLIIGREGLLKINIHANFENDEYENILLFSSAFGPTGTIDTIDFVRCRRNYLPVGNYDTTIVEKYLYDYNHEIILTLRSENLHNHITNYEILERVDLLPLDTTYVSLVLK